MPRFDDQTIYQLFGNEDAENENPERLKSYFFRNRAYESLKADLPIRVLVGHKGVGKSAILKICHLEDEDDGILSLWVRPNDVFGSVDTSASSFLALIENWKVGLATLIVRKALEGGELYEEASKVERITGGVRHLLSALGNHYLKGRPDISQDAARTMQRFIKNQRIRVYLDDLDRGWEARKEDISNISALLNAVRDMAGEDSRIQFRVGLRTDVYHLVRTSDESTDKIEANLVWLLWSNHEILTTMAKRVATYFGEEVDEKQLVKLKQSEIAIRLNKVIEPRFHGRGKWENEASYRILMTLTRKRPRDLVKLFYYAAKEAFKDDAEIISSGHLIRIFEKYSTERLRDVVNEFRTELPGIEDVLLGMRQTKKERDEGIGPVFDDGQLNRKIETIIRGSNLYFTNGQSMNATALARFLYKCDFVTARLDSDSGIIRKHFEENQMLMSGKANFGSKWEIHPAYRWALAPQDTSTLFERIDLTETERT